MQEARSLGLCPGLSEPLLLADATGTKILCAGPLTLNNQRPDQTILSLNDQLSAILFSILRLTSASKICIQEKS